jgi:hypothetical protein
MRIPNNIRLADEECFETHRSFDRRGNMYFGKYYVSARSKRKVPVRSVRKRYSGGLLEVQVQFPTATVKKTSRVIWI